MFLSIFKNQRFKGFFVADIISSFGAGMSFIGANWFVMEFTGTNKAVGSLLAVTLASGLVIFPFAGTIADRFRRTKVMVVANITRAIASAIIAAALIAGKFDMRLIYLLAVIAGAGWAIFMPASRAFVQEVLPREDYIKGSSFIEVSLQVGMFTAAAACGIVYKYLGFPAILLIETCTFLAGSYFLSRIKYEAIIAPDKGEVFYKQFINGGRYLLRHPATLAFGIAMFIPFVATMSSNVILPGYVNRHLMADTVVFGFADMSYSMGACLSGFIAAHLVSKLGRHRTVIMFFVASTMTQFYLVANAGIAGLYIASLIFGLGNSSLRIALHSQAMELVPTEYMGRCMSVWMALSMIMQVASAYGLGSLTDILPVRFGFLWLAAIMMAGFGGYLWLAQKIRDVAAKPASAPNI